MKKIITLIACVSLSTIALSAQASLIGNENLSINTGTGTVSTGPLGSWFAMEVQPGVLTYVSLTGKNGINLGTTQLANEGNSSTPGDTPFFPTTPTPPSFITNITQDWTFFGNIGTDQTTSPVTVFADNGNGNVLLDFSGWGITWNSIPNIPLGAGLSNGVATMTCIGDCGINGVAYTLDYQAKVPSGDPSGFGNVNYTLHLEGNVSTVPIPSALWLFITGLLTLVGFHKRHV